MTRTRVLSMILFASLAFNLFLGGVTIGRWAGRGEPEMHIGRNAGHWLKHLTNDGVSAEVQSLWQKHQTALEPLRHDGKTTRRKVSETLAANPFDAGAYAKALQAQQEHSTRIRGRHQAFMLDLVQILTPKQRKHLAERAGRWRWRPHRD